MKTLIKTLWLPTILIDSWHAMIDERVIIHEHAFGIIGSAMMPISELFPKAGITFWDCAHPYLAQIYANDAKYYPIYAKCCELDIPIIFTTGTATLVPNAIIDHVAPRYIDFVARDFPELKIIISHGGYPWVNEAITVAQRNRNV